MTTATDEIEVSQRADRQQIRADADAVESLVAHPGWKVFLRLIEAVSQNYHKTVMTPIATSFECVKVEYAKGTLLGLSIAAQLPSAKMREAQELKIRPTDEGDEE